jgi:hypothetical protein
MNTSVLDTGEGRMKQFMATKRNDDVAVLGYSNTVWSYRQIPQRETALALCSYETFVCTYMCTRLYSPESQHRYFNMWELQSHMKLNESSPTAWDRTWILEAKSTIYLSERRIRCSATNMHFHNPTQFTVQLERRTNDVVRKRREYNRKQKNVRARGQARYSAGILINASRFPKLPNKSTIYFQTHETSSLDKDEKVFISRHLH